MNINRRSFVFGTAITLLCITGCNTTTGKNTSFSSGEKELDTSKLQLLIDQLKVDLDRYEMDSDMRAYSSRVSKAMSLITSGNATQDAFLISFCIVHSYIYVHLFIFALQEIHPILLFRDTLGTRLSHRMAERKELGP